MNKLIVTFLLIISFNTSSAQTGWGYVNYTSYKTHNGTGAVNQYSQHAYTAADFDVMFNTANSNTTISHTGETQIVNLYNGSGVVPRWGNDFFGYRFDFWFIPQQTGTYYFGINSDDASDLSIDGVVRVTYYGGHGASSWQVVPFNMVAGQRYRMVYRGQEYAGGEAFYFMWYRPVGGWGYWNNEVTNTPPEPTKRARINFNFGTTTDETKFSAGSALNSTGWVDVTTLIDSVKINSLYKPQSATISTTNTLSTFYNSVVTVADVYMAFKEISNVGLYGDQTGNEFVYGIQYKNADINDDDVFNELDCFRLLQQLTGTRTLVDTFNLNKTLKLIPKVVYDTIYKSNWKNFPTFLGNKYNFDINTGKAIDTFYVAATWKGDVNLSHSATPATTLLAISSVKAFSTSVSKDINLSIVTEIINDTVYATLNLDPLSQQVTGTQFKLSYDNQVLNYVKTDFKTVDNITNFGVDKGTYINLGSIVTNGSGVLDSKTEYKVTFIPKSKLTNVLGLVSIIMTDAVNQSGDQLKVIIN